MSSLCQPKRLTLLAEADSQMIANSNSRDCRLVIVVNIASCVFTTPGLYYVDDLQDRKLNRRTPFLHRLEE